MTRRRFLAGAVASVGALPMALPAALAEEPAKTHIVTLSFDDGFKKSFFEVASIYEEFGLRGCFNVIALGDQPEFRPTVAGQPDQGIVGFPKGSFADWNELKRRGHEVMAHTYNHKNLTELPLAEAKELIVRCADYFEAHLEGFKASDSVYNFAYNASTPELERFALTRFLVVRTQGDTPVNPIPRRRVPVRIGCFSHGPDRCDQFLSDEIEKFLASPGGWFVFNTHGLNDEGWGPLGSDTLRALLRRLVGLPQVEVLPAGAVVLRLPRA